MEPRIIKPKEVKVGDTIRIEQEIVIKNLETHPTCISANWNTWGLDYFDTITLLNRPLPPHKYSVGQKVWYLKFTKHTIFEITELCGHLPGGEPRYRIYPSRYVVTEFELTPVVEEAWEPKFGELVKYGSVKCVVIITPERTSPFAYCLRDEDDDYHIASLSELSKWEGD